MTPNDDAILGTSVHRLRQLAAVGAGPAGAALARLLDTPVKPGSPRVRASGDEGRLGSLTTRIVFDTEGDLMGVVAILLPQRVKDFAVERLVGRVRPGARIEESALCELGNIIASQTVSAIADSLGATIMLSVPRLSTRGAGDAARAADAADGAVAPVRVETDLLGADGELQALLVFSPRAAPEKAL